MATKLHLDRDLGWVVGHTPSGWSVRPDHWDPISVEGRCMVRSSHSPDGPSHVVQHGIMTMGATLSVAMLVLGVSGCERGSDSFADATAGIAKQAGEGDPPLQQPAEAKLPLAERLAAIPSKVRVTTNSMGMRFITIPAGKFRMGSPAEDQEARPDEQPQIDVEIGGPFELGQTEVTRGEFRRFVEATGYRTLAEREKGGFAYNARTQRLEPDIDSSWRRTGFEQTDEHPVINVAVEDAEAYCRWLTQETGETHRLPTEREWEYACRAGTTTKWSTGDDLDSVKQSCNLCDVNLERLYPFANWSVAWNDGYAFTAPVATYRSNPFGLFDMHGNVFEWCADRWPDTGYDGRPLSDPDEPMTPGSRIVRGGSFLSLTMFTRSADRVGLGPELRNCIVGFRVVREVAPQGNDTATSSAGTSTGEARP